MDTEELHRRLTLIDERRRHFEWKSAQPNRLARHEVWRHSYLAYPYLVGAPATRIADRFRQVFLNVTEVGPNGKLCPAPWLETDEIHQLFTHLLEEYGSRGGGVPSEIIQSAREPILKYFQNGTPPGIRMFAGYKTPKTPHLVKYGKREFLEPMYSHGILRLANAKSYNNASFSDAIRDDETSRYFFIPTFRERLDGKSHVTINGHRLEFGDDDIVLPLVFDDYYIFSACEQIHYRMPTDFDADAAIVIRNPTLFKQRVISAFAERQPEWIPMEGKVVYYDPYRDYSKFNLPHMAKHFGYAYQKEVRIAFRPAGPSSIELEPIFLSIGSMADYAEILTL